MPKINVARSFQFNDGKEVRVIPVGIVDVDDATAAHWWVQAHSVPVADGTEQDGQAKTKLGKKA